VDRTFHSMKTIIFRRLYLILFNNVIWIARIVYNVSSSLTKILKCYQRYENLDIIIFVTVFVINKVIQYFIDNYST